MATLDFVIENMHCSSCVRSVMRTINALPGTHAEEVRVGAARVTTEADPRRSKRRCVMQAIPRTSLR